MPAFKTVWSQLFPSVPPALTETNLPSQVGKVFCVTGANSGVGFELAKILYAKGGRVYMACRSEEKAEKAIESIKQAKPDSKGELCFLSLQLDDLAKVKASAESFKAKERRLDVLWNNAGVAFPPVGSSSAQGTELTMGSNCVGPFLFTKLLLPELRAAAQSSNEPGSTRVVWTSSVAAEDNVTPGGVDISTLDSSPPDADQKANYRQTKSCNFLLAAELARREPGIVSVTQNPGNLRTATWNNVPKIAQYLMALTLHDPVYGAYTELWAGLSKDVKPEDSGRYIVPWGQWHPDLREDLVDAVRSKEQGGTGIAAAFWQWCENKTSAFM